MSGMAWRLNERYEVYGRLAVGASGTAWRGRDLAGGAECLVKVLRPELAADPAALAEAQRTFHAVAALGHRGIVAVDEMVVQEGHAALVGRFVPGRSLRALLEEQGPFPADRATSLASQVASALAAVHAAGFEHGNLTAAQVLISTAPDDVVVTDFGIAPLINRAAARGLLPFVPVPRYQAPELRTGDPGTPTADVFALGMLFYEALSGRHPFAISREDDAVLVVRDAPEPIAGLSLSLWNLITGCLAPNPINRPTAAHVARLLASHVPPAPVAAPAAASSSAPSSPEDSPTIFMPVIRAVGDVAPQPHPDAEQSVDASSNSAGYAGRRAANGRRRVALSGLGLGAVAVAAIVAFTGSQSGGSNTSTGKDVPVEVVPHSGEPDLGAGSATASTHASATNSASAHATASASASASARVSASATKGAAGALAVGGTSATPGASASTLAPPNNGAGNAPLAGSSLVNGHSGSCLETQNGAFANGTAEQLWTCGSAAGEGWAFAGNGTLTQDGGAYCLDDYAFGATPGSRVALWSCNNGANQHWTIRPDGSVLNTYSGLCLDVAGQSTANGAQIVLANCGGGSSQHWSLQ